MLVPELPLRPRASQDDVAAAASVTPIGASKLLPGLAVEAAQPVASTSSSYKQPATVHKMPFLQKAQQWILTPPSFYETSSRLKCTFPTRDRLQNEKLLILVSLISPNVQT